MQRWFHQMQRLNASGGAAYGALRDVESTWIMPQPFLLELQLPERLQELSRCGVGDLSALGA
jgi:hypothetical protein